MKGPLRYLVGGLHVGGGTDRPTQVSSQLLLRYDVGELWYAMLPRSWVSLAVVCPERTAKTVRLARSLAELGTQSLGRRVVLLNATQVDLAFVAGVTDRLARSGSSQTAVPHQFVIALDSPIVNPLAVGVMAACDSALLLLVRGQTTIPGARRTIELIGRERLLGAVIASD